MSDTNHYMQCLECGNVQHYTFFTETIACHATCFLCQSKSVSFITDCDKVLTESIVGDWCNEELRRRIQITRRRSREPRSRNIRFSHNLRVSFDKDTCAIGVVGTPYSVILVPLEPFRLEELNTVPLSKQIKQAFIATYAGDKRATCASIYQDFNGLKLRDILYPVTVALKARLEADEAMMQIFPNTAVLDSLTRPHYMED